MSFEFLSMGAEWIRSESESYTHLGREYSVRFDVWECSFVCEGREERFEFKMAEALKGAEPESPEVLECLISDAQAAEEEFEEFCHSFGYDSDSRKAEAIWRACRENGERVRALLGDHFDEVCQALAGDPEEF